MELTIQNNWEELTWLIDNEDVTGKLKTITLEFPDGTVKGFKVTWTLDHEQYYDHGKPCYAEQYNAFIKLPLLGLRLKTHLGDVARDVKIIDYTIGKIR